MNKEDFIAFLNSPKSIYIAIEVLKAYCEEKGKDSRKLEILLNFVDAGILLPDAIEYFKKKFNVTELSNQNHIIKYY